MNAARVRAIIRGVLALSRGDAGGLAAFEATPEALLRSLSPWLALALTGILLGIADGTPLPAAMSDGFAIISAILLPLVLTHAYAARVDRLQAWPRYATALNWCNWAIPAALLALLVVAGVLRLPQTLTVGVAVVGVSGFELWLHIVVARHGLGLRLPAAVALVAATEFASGALLVLHSYLGGDPPA